MWQGKLSELEEVENVAALEEEVETALSSLCHDEMVECRLNGQVMIYSLKQRDV